MGRKECFQLLMCKNSNQYICCVIEVLSIVHRLVICNIACTTIKMCAYSMKTFYIIIITMCT